MFTPARVIHSASAAKFLMRAAAERPLLAGLLALALPAVLGCDAGADCGLCLLQIDPSDCAIESLARASAREVGSGGRGGGSIMSAVV